MSNSNDQYRPKEVLMLVQNLGPKNFRELRKNANPRATANLEDFVA